MPHRPRPRGYEALDIFLKTRESAGDALEVKDWTLNQQRYLKDFTEYDKVNKIEFTRDGKTQHRFKDKATGRFVKGY